MPRMDSKPSLEKGKLPDLPGSDDKWWSGKKHKIEMMPRPRCEHFFIRRSGREVECRYCGAGFFTGGGDILKEGHLYHDGLRMI